MRSGQLARRTGLSTDTLRHYERLGLLPVPQRTPGNYREYPVASQQRVDLIQRALAVGFSLGELKTILAVRDRGETPCRQVRALMGLKVRELDKQIKNLASFRAELKRLSSQWDKRLRHTKPGELARLLEAVPPRAGIGIASRFATFGRKKGH